jgi:predicted secreted hydrolase
MKFSKSISQFCCLFGLTISLISVPLEARTSDQSPRLFADEVAKEHGVHWDALTEWWYFVGHLQAESGRIFGYQLSFFKFSVIGFFAHIAITDDAGKSHSFIRKYYLPGEAILSEDTLDLQYGVNAATALGEDMYAITGQTDRGAFELRLQSKKAPLLVDGTGLIAMPQGGNSYYYSLTQLHTIGRLTWDGEDFEVTGKSWMDHQWGDFTSLVSGWDWFSIQMDDGSEYNIYSFRNSDESILRQHIGISQKDGISLILNRAELKRIAWWKSPATGNHYVTKWQIHLPDSGEIFDVEATVPGQEIYSQSLFDVAPTYWEGRCKISRVKDGIQTFGVGYAEHFPYAGQIP